ncbi:UNVERIFIED_CONTAM: Retrovirus-related Pol polyprotein from transposon TNT 1-94 [Sesamum calycinum]|uniref:Retrovirus-related Pol polyprotein from transposon TNT 1-94 n=1 Tax=Sesamum calycinum TaxID=2727403 RepID=A0AAW2PSP3_9LAMI
MSRSITNKLYLKQRQYGLKMHEGFDLAQHVNIFNQIITDLARLDVSIEDEDRIEVKGKKMIHCYKYKESGHMKRDCPKLKKQADEKCDYSSKFADVVQNDNSDCSDGVMLSISTNQSGNSSSVYLGDDRYCNIVGIGELRIKMNVWVYFLKQKFEVFAKFKLWKAKVENQTGRKIKYLRSDNGTEYTDSQFQKLWFPKSFWAEAVSMACYLINRSPWALLGEKVAKEIEARPEVQVLHFSGFTRNVPSAYMFWDLVARKIVISRDVVFDEQSMPQQHQDKMQKIGSSSIILQMELEPHPTKNRGSSHPMSGDLVVIESDGSSHPTSSGSTTNELQAYNLAKDRQRRTNIKPPSMLGYEDIVSFALLISGDEQTTFHGAITS